jgi:hypothetical protein
VEKGGIDGMLGWWQGKRIGVWNQVATRTNYSTGIYNLFEQAAADMEQAGDYWEESKISST